MSRLDRLFAWYERRVNLLGRLVRALVRLRIRIGVDDLGAPLVQRMDDTIRMTWISGNGEEHIALAASVPAARDLVEKLQAAIDADRPAITD